MKQKIIISDLFHKAWKSLKAQIWVLVGLVIGYIIISLLINAFIPTPSNGNIGIAGIVIMLISLLFYLIFTLGYTKNLFQALDGEEPQFSAYGQMSRKIFTYLFASLIYGIIVIIGLILLLIPGIYLILRLQFYPMSIVEENTGVIESLKRSWEITRGSERQLFFLMLAILGIVILGHLALLIGVFIAIPLTGLMSCYAFRKLTIPTIS